MTHTLLGLAIGEAVFRPRLGRRAVTASMWAANLPDIDVLVHLTGDPGAIVLRRSFGHSLFFLPIWIAGLAWIFKKKYPDMTYRDLLAIVSINAGGHLLFDLINSFGVQLLWPLSLSRPELAIVFIIDLVLSGILAAPHLARLSAAWKPRLTRACRGALVLAAAYLMTAYACRRRAEIILNGASSSGGFAYVFPEPLGAHRWRGVIKEPSSWHVYLIDVLNGSADKKLVLDDDSQTPPAVEARQTAFGRRLDAFFKAPVWTAAPKPGGGWTATVRDLRFSSLTLTRPPTFEFVFDVEAAGSAVPRGVKIW